jgi:parallel beta-helix repeat protein
MGIGSNLQSKINKIASDLQALVIGQFGTGFVTDEMLSGASGKVKDLVGQHSTQLGNIAVNVKSFGATGDGVTDDTASIQSAIDYVSTNGKGTVIISDGTYLIDADYHTGKSIQMKSNVNLEMSANTILKAIPNNLTHYQILMILNKENIVIRGGTLIGERDEHVGITGEWGMGVAITGASKNIRVENVVAKNFWGDGFFIAEDGENTPESIVLQNCIGDNNRRQGTSVTAGKDILITGCTMKNTNGTNPEAGIDCESNFPENISILQDCRIVNCRLENNNGYGIAFSKCENHQAIGNTVEGNNKGGIYGGNSSKIIIQSNHIRNNGGATGDATYGSGIHINYTDGCNIEGNISNGNTKHGISGINGISETLINGNSCKGNTDSGVYIDGSNTETSIMISHNICLGNKYGINIKEVSKSSIIGNVCGNSVNGNGILAYAIKDCNISLNNCSLNEKEGLYLSDNDNNIISSNTCVGN